MTGAPVPPWPPLLVRDLLVAHEPLRELVADRISTRSSSVALPFVLVRSAGNLPILTGYDMHQPLVQVEGCCPPDVEGDPEVLADAISQRVLDALGRVRNHQARGVAFSIRHVDGPLSTPDTSRGTESPIYRSITRHELTLRSLPAA